MKRTSNKRRARGRRFWQMFAIVAAAAILAVGTQAPRADAATRTVNGNVSFRIMDWENFGSNERCYPSMALTPRRVGVDDLRTVTLTAYCGNEIRVEVRYSLRQLSNGQVQVYRGRVDFFEGDTAYNGDLDGTTYFSTRTLRPGVSTTWNIHVENWQERQPDDRADVTLTLRYR